MTRQEVVEYLQDLLEDDKLLLYSPESDDRIPAERVELDGSEIVVYPRA